MNKSLKVISLYAGPGAGKSTTAAGLFYLMKRNGMSAELVTEYAKEKVYDGFLGCLEDQIYIFGQQQRRLKRLVGHVEFAITDSPILLSTLYNKDLSPTFDKFVLETYHSYSNIGFFIERAKPYVAVGRTQDFAQACELDIKMENIIEKNDIPVHYVRGDEFCTDTIYHIIRDQHEK